MTPNRTPLSTLAAASALTAASMGGMATAANDTSQAFKEMLGYSYLLGDFDASSFLFTRKPTQVEKIAFPRDQRKRRKNNRRAFAAGNKKAFN